MKKGLIYLLILLALAVTACIALYLIFGWGSVAEFQKDIDRLFWACVRLLQIWGDWTGLGYNLLNIIIFIILQPLLILLFFILWRIEVFRRKKLER